jgi:F0F1-type ATP synthase epsilon subunit
MQLVMVTPNKKEIITIAWIELNTPSGNYVIQPGHAPTILALSKEQPLIYCLKNGKQEIVMVNQGVAQITRNQVTVLLN